MRIIVGSLGTVSEGIKRNTNEIAIEYPAELLPKVLDNGKEQIARYCRLQAASPIRMQDSGNSNKTRINNHKYFILPQD